MFDWLLLLNIGFGLWVSRSIVQKQGTHTVAVTIVLKYGNGVVALLPNIDLNHEISLATDYNAVFTP